MKSHCFRKALPVAVGAIAVFSVHEQQGVQALGGASTRPSSGRTPLPRTIRPCRRIRHDLRPSPIRAHGRPSARATCQVFGVVGHSEGRGRLDQQKGRLDVVPERVMRGDRPPVAVSGRD